MDTPNTADELKLRLARQGRSIADLARELGLMPSVVYALLGGRVNGTRGKCRAAALALGLIRPGEGSASPAPSPELDRERCTSRPLICLLELPHVDELVMDDGQITPHAPSLGGFAYSSQVVTLHHTAHGADPLTELVRTLQSLPCVQRVPFLSDSFTLRLSADGQAAPNGPCYLRFRIVESPACECCPLNATPHAED